MLVDSLRLDSSIQPRMKIDPAIVREYAAAMSEGTQFPPVIVFHDGDNYWVADGFHRIMAAKEAGLTHIDAEVRVGTPRDAVLYAVGTNSAHGIRRSNADKRRAVEMLLSDEEWRQLSNIEIARRCVVSHTFVNSVREELSRNGTESPAKRKCADGRIIDTANIGKPIGTTELSDVASEDDGKGVAASTDFTMSEASARNSTPKGKNIPVECIVADSGGEGTGRTCNAFAMTSEEAVEYLQHGVVPHRANARMDDAEFFSLLLEYIERKESTSNTRIIVLREKMSAIV